MAKHRFVVQPSPNDLPGSVKQLSRLVCAEAMLTPDASTTMTNRARLIDRKTLIFKDRRCPCERVCTAPGHAQARDGHSHLRRETVLFHFGHFWLLEDFC